MANEVLKRGGGGEKKRWGGGEIVLTGTSGLRKSKRWISEFPPSYSRLFQIHPVLKIPRQIVGKVR